MCMCVCSETHLTYHNTALPYYHHIIPILLYTLQYIALYMYMVYRSQSTTPFKLLWKVPWHTKAAMIGIQQKLPKIILNLNSCDCKYNKSQSTPDLNQSCQDSLSRDFLMMSSTQRHCLKRKSKIATVRVQAHTVPLCKLHQHNNGWVRTLGTTPARNPVRNEKQVFNCFNVQADNWNMILCTTLKKKLKVKLHNTCKLLHYQSQTSTCIAPSSTAVAPNTPTPTSSPTLHQQPYQ